MKKYLYATTAFLCALFLALALWVPSEPVQADPPADRGQGRGHSTALFLDSYATIPNCSISCSDGTNKAVEADNAGDCACQCADFCEATCTASGGGQTASCSPE